MEEIKKKDKELKKQPNKINEIKKPDRLNSSLKKTTNVNNRISKSNKINNNIEVNNKKRINWTFVVSVLTLLVTVVSLWFSVYIGYIIPKNERIEDMNKKEMFIQSLTNDLSMNYINEVIGEPIYSYLTDEIINNYYVVNSNVIICMFDNQKLIGYFIFVNSNNPIKYITWVDEDKPLGDITYDSVNLSMDGPYKIEYAYSGTTPAYKYYFEIYYGTMSNTNGEFYLFGNYMDDSTELIFKDLWDSVEAGKYIDAEDKIFCLSSRRDEIKPNVYGQITEEYIEKVKCIDEIENINGRNIIQNIFNGYIS